MAQLDKTFPTNDCSMCILSPKMVEVGRNPNVTIHTCSEVESVEGEAGNFHVRVRKTPPLHHRGRVQRVRGLHPDLPGGGLQPV